MATVPEQNQADLSTPISVPTRIDRQNNSHSGSLRSLFQGAFNSDNPAVYIQQIQPTQSPSANNQFLPYYLASRQLYDLMDEMADKCPVIGGTEETVASMVLSREQRIEAPAGVDEAVVQPIVEFCRKAIFGMGADWTNALKLLVLGARRHGFSVSEVRYELRDGNFYPVLDHRHPGMFDFALDGTLLMNEGGLNPRLVPRFRFVINRNAAFYANPYGQSETFPLRWDYYLWKNAKKAWADGIETFGLPLLIARIAAAVQERGTVKGQVEDVMRNLRGDSGAVLPEGVTLEAITRGLTSAGVPHSEFVEYLEKEMVRSLTGSTLSTMENGGTGSLAQSKVHGQVANDRLVAICNSLADTVKRDILSVLVRINFGPDAPVPDFIIDTDDEEDVYPAIAIFKAGAELGIPLSKSQAQEWFGLATPKDDDDTLEPVMVGATVVDPAAAIGAAAGDALGAPGRVPGFPTFSDAGPHPDGCRCGCGSGQQARPFFFAPKTRPLKPSSSPGRRVRI